VLSSSNSADTGIPPDQGGENQLKLYKMIARGALFLLLLSLAMSTAGCSKKQSAPVPSNNRLQAKASTGATRISNENPKKVAAHLEKLATGIKGVKGANCVVFGKYAIVGIDVDSKMERSQVGTLKYTVAEAFRKDPYGIDAVVTADMDLTQRLREIKIDVKKGRPIAGFTEELADIIGRVIPQIPRNIIPPKTPEDMGTSSSNMHKK
jgi:YhcN/YlaJ family sporulation lipoprotein